MKTAAYFAALAMLAGSVTSSRADDYLSGYLDLGHQYEKQGPYHAETSVLAGVIQYRLDDCAAGLNISESRFDGLASTNITAFGAEAGCRVKNLWVTGLVHASLYDGEDEIKPDVYGVGLHYILNDQYRLGLVAQRYDNGFMSYMTYGITSNYFLDDDVLLSSSLELVRLDILKQYKSFSKIEYKLKDRPISLYAGVGAGWGEADDASFSYDIVTATAGLRFYFSDGSLKTIINNSMPGFGD